MKVLLTILLMVVATISQAATRSIFIPNSQIEGQKRVALVIGNSKYKEVPKLANPEKDVRAISGELSQLGFQVTEVTNATQKEMNRAIAFFGDSLTSDTAALFYFAGHGLQVRGRNYLVPVDANITSESSIPAETVDLETVLAQLNNSSLSIVILDACRNNPFQKARSLGSGGLAMMDAPKGSFIAYATSPGKTASDGTAGNGLYTKELINQMRTKGLSLEEVFKRVRSNVAMTTSDEQIPWESTSLTGNFYFSGKPEPIIDSKELALWNRANTTNNQADFDSYLAQYPNGQFAVAAKSAKSALEEQQKLALVKVQMEEDKTRQMEEQQKMEVVLQKMEAEKAMHELQQKEAAERELRLKSETQAKQAELDRIMAVFKSLEKLLVRSGQSIDKLLTPSGKMGEKNNSEVYKISEEVDIEVNKKPIGKNIP